MSTELQNLIPNNAAEIRSIRAQNAAKEKPKAEDTHETKGRKGTKASKSEA